jgi:hypothetical protein
LLQVIQPAYQTMLCLVKVRQGFKSPVLARLRPLAVFYVEHGETVIYICDRRGHATVHTAAGEDDG